jgi:hypothetical protein
MKTTTESSPMEASASSTMEASASSTTAAAVSGSPCYGSERYQADTNYQANQSFCFHVSRSLLHWFVSMAHQ